MTTLQLMLHICEERAIGFLDASGNNASAEALRDFSNDTAPLFDAASQIGRAALAVIQQVRREVEPLVDVLQVTTTHSHDVLRMMRDCGRILVLFNEAETTIASLERQIPVGLAGIQAAVLEREVAPEAVRTFQALLSRIRGG